MEQTGFLPATIMHAHGAHTLHSSRETKVIGALMEPDGEEVFPSADLLSAE